MPAFADTDPAGQIPSAAANAPTFTVGERWEFAYENFLEPQKNERFSQTVASSKPDETVLVNGQGRRFALDASSNVVETPSTKFEPNDGRLMFPMTVGKQWSSTYVVRSGSWTAKCDRTAQVVSRERVSTPAGEFDAFRIDHRVAWSGMSASQGSGLTIEHDWYAPAVGRVVKIEYQDMPLKGAVTATTVQLTRYVPAATDTPEEASRTVSTQSKDQK